VDAEARDRPIADEHVIPSSRCSAGAALPDVLARCVHAGAHLGRVTGDGAASGLVALEDVLERLHRDAPRRRPVDRSAGAPRGGAGGGR
jgi:CBS domain containing-hemolysin-like protein